MIHLFTDFGPFGPYQGQMTAALRRHAPEVPVIDLLNDAPMFEPRLAAYLLAACLDQIPVGDVLLAVVDPGVGTARLPLALALDGRWLVGPDNGLFEPALRRASHALTFHIVWQPRNLSASFHGRDLFAPVAADLARGQHGKLAAGAATRLADWPDDLPAIVYIDRYGNAMTGLRATGIRMDSILAAGQHRLPHAPTFGAVPPGHAFWYRNSLGLIEIAANGASAARLLDLSTGDAVGLTDGQALPKT
jgi:S-adenosylmethionine hydrolase